MILRHRLEVEEETAGLTGPTMGTAQTNSTNSANSTDPTDPTDPMDSTDLVVVSRCPSAARPTARW